MRDPIDQLEIRERYATQTRAFILDQVPLEGMDHGAVIESVENACKDIWMCHTRIKLEPVPPAYGRLSLGDAEDAAIRALQFLLDLAVKFDPTYTPHY